MMGWRLWHNFLEIRIFMGPRPKNAVIRSHTASWSILPPNLPVLSPVNDKPFVMNFDGADMSSDAGLTLLREVERRLGMSGVLASCLDDPRDPSKVQHSLEDIIRFRMMMIAAGHEDGNDAADLRHDPSFKIALERHPEPGAALCSQRPKRSQWRHAQFDTLRLHLVKLAATIVEKKTRIVMTLPTSCPRQSLIRLLLKTLAPPRPT